MTTARRRIAAVLAILAFIGAIAGFEAVSPDCMYRMEESLCQTR